MSSSFSSKEADLGVTDDYKSSSVVCSRDDRTSSQNGALQIELKNTSKHEGIQETAESITSPSGGDENQCPNSKQALRNPEETTRLSSCHSSGLDLTQRRSTASCDCTDEKNTTEDKNAIENSNIANADSAVTDNLNDVSMMSLDGNVSVNLGAENVIKMPNETESLRIAIASSRRSNTCEDTFIDSKANRTSTGFTEGSMLKTPTNVNTEVSKSTSVCEDDVFLTPTQDLSSKDGSNLTKSLSNSPKEEVKSQLDGTFDKAESEVSIIESKNQGTFDKQPSFLDPGIEVAQSCRITTPDFDLRLDSTNRPEDNALDGSEVTDTMSTPNKKDSSGMFTYRGVSEKDITETHGRQLKKVSSASECDELNVEPDLEKKERRSSSFLKRRCSLLELSFVSSPKRANFQLKTPKTGEKSSHSSLINFNESIAFDFTAAAKYAEINGGVAEMGSFVFSATSGLPVPDFIEPPSTSPQRKSGSSLTSKDEKFTRVSFIAMFDPIKVQDGQKNNSEPDKRETPVSIMDRKCSVIASQQTSISSPLIKGLPTPVFVKPKPLHAASKSVGMQTDDAIVEHEKIAENEQVPSSEEIADEMAKLNKVIQDQSRALLTYEEVVKKIAGSRRKKQENPSEDSKLKVRLDEERIRNEQLEDAVRSMERSMHSTLMRMQEFRTANEDLRKVVEEQQNALIDTRAELDDCQTHWQQEVAIRDEERQRLKAHWDETSLAHEKAVSMLKLQLQAKESEIESLHMQNAIARKEVDSLRTLVSSMKLQ